MEMRLCENGDVYRVCGEIGWRRIEFEFISKLKVGEVIFLEEICDAVDLEKNYGIYLEPNVKDMTKLFAFQKTDVNNHYDILF